MVKSQNECQFCSHFEACLNYKQGLLYSSPFVFLVQRSLLSTKTYMKRGYRHIPLHFYTYPVVTIIACLCLSENAHMYYLLLAPKPAPHAYPAPAPAPHAYPAPAPAPSGYQSAPAPAPAAPAPALADHPAVKPWMCTQWYWNPWLCKGKVTKKTTTTTTTTTTTQAPTTTTTKATTTSSPPPTMTTPSTTAAPVSKCYYNPPCPPPSHHDLL